jgi:DNA-binding NtrC family response regulator
LLRIAAEVDTIKKILVVDDEPSIGKLVKMTLERRGFRVDVETASDRALAFLQQHSAEVDLLISDVRMPGIDGPALAERALAARPGLPIILISGYTDGNQLSGVMQAQFTFISKPFDAAVLIGKVREILADNSS